MKRQHSLLQKKSPQGGAILVQFALLGFVLITILGTVQIGYMYYAKRDMQRVVDIAALEAVNAITYGDASTCTAADGEDGAGHRSINAQLHLALNNEVRQITCGHWDGSQSDTQRFSTNYASTPAANTLNAVQVTLRGETLQLLPILGSRVVSATAIASKDSESVAAFSVGAQLLRFENGALLGRILQSLGVNIQDLRVLDSDGVATASITPSGLLQKIGMLLGIEQLINLDLAALTASGVANIPNIHIADIIQASASLIESETATALISIANAIRVNPSIGNIKIPLIGSNENSGVFSFIGLGANNSPIGAAADVRLNVSDVIRTALALGVNDHALTLGFSLLGETISTKLMVVEPPSIGIGPIGTKAYNAQVRLNIDVDTDELPGLGRFLSSTLLRLDLPLAIDLTSAEGTLQKISCDASPPTVDILVNSHIGDICIGHISPNNFGRCSNSLTETNALDLRLILIPLLKVNIKSYTPLLPANPEVMKNLSENEDPRSTSANTLQLGETVNQLLNNLEVDARLLGLIPIGTLVDTVKEILTPILSTLLSPVDGLLAFLVSPLLTEILGIEIGRTEVDVLSIQCTTAQLVY